MVKTRNTEKHSAIRDEILSVAIELFVANGFEQTSLRSIAAAAKFSPAAIYRYFANKDAILGAIYKTGFEKFALCMFSLEQCDSYLQTLQQSMGLYIQFAVENPELYRLLFMDLAPTSAIDDPTNRKAAQDNFDIHLQLVAKAAIEAGWTEDSIETIALSLWASMHGIASLHVAQRLFVSSVGAIEQVDALLARLLK